MYRVQLDAYEGPLDLLLHFVRRDELDVHAIPIARIADEYLAYVRAMEALDLDGAGDFIYMAAELIALKARMLLPRPPAEEGQEPVDPQRELAERLLAYVRYKEAAGLLEGRQEQRAQHFVRGPASDERSRFDEPAEQTYRVSLFDLVSVLRRALDRAPQAPPAHELKREAYGIDTQAVYLLEATAQRPASFVRLVEGRSRAFVVATFLAVLELARRQAVRLVFGHAPDDFAVEAVPAQALPAPVPPAPPPALA